MLHVCMYHDDARMHAHMHVCMYACMHVCMYACMRARMYVCMYVCTGMHARTHACVVVGSSWVTPSPPSVSLFGGGERERAFLTTMSITGSL